MANNMDSLVEAERQLMERARTLEAMEAEIEGELAGVDAMEQSLSKRHATLSSLLSYVKDQEQGLLKRAETIGSRARALAEETLATGSGNVSHALPALGCEAQRRDLISRRQELVAQRAEQLEELRAIHAARLDAVEAAEAAFDTLEARLMEREQVISEALRRLIVQADTLTGDEPPRAAAAPRVSAAPPAAASPGGAATGVTVEAGLGPDQRNQLFRYEADGPEDLPGLFVATANLLAEDREVHIRMRWPDGRQIETQGIVSWRREPGDDPDGPGMGIELVTLTDDERKHIQSWLQQHPAMVV